MKPGRYGDGGNLYLYVRENGSRAWLVRYTLPGRKARDMGLGCAEDVSLADARELARQARLLLQQGKDPLEERHAEQQASVEAGMTFKEVGEKYIAAHTPGWKSPKHAAQWTSTLESYAYGTVGNLAVSAVRVSHILKILEPIWATKNETASRLRGRIENILDYAGAQGWRTGDNPARWKGHLNNLLPAPGKVATVEHHPALPWQECPAFMRELSTRPGVAAQALQLTILTAARNSEITLAVWSEFDLEGKIWTVPAIRMKNEIEHRVPLCDMAIAILLDRRGRGQLPDAVVFPGDKPGGGLSDAAMTSVLKRMGRDDITVHGFRSSFRDWAADATDHPGEAAEAALAHVNKNKVEAAYLRTKLFARRRVMMTDWGAFLSGTTGKAAQET